MIKITKYSPGKKMLAKKDQLSYSQYQLKIRFKLKRAKINTFEEKFNAVKIPQIHFFDIP